jgi:hypothetical protein
MAFGLPLDPDFRKTVVGFWLDDVDDRIQIGDIEGAKRSWHEGRNIYLSLPPGFGDLSLEDRISQYRVKLDRFTQHKQ